MKSTLLILLVALCAACSSGPSESATDPDSLSNDNDTTVAPSDTEEPQEISEPDNADSLVAVLQSRAEQVVASVQSKLSVYETISISNSGYESGSDATWYFDSAMNVRFYDASWSMEGTDGNYKLVFKDDEFIGGTEENGYPVGTENFWYINNADDYFGFSRLSDDGEERVNFIYDNGFQAKRTEVLTYRDNLFQRIREIADSAEVGEETVTYHAESIQNYGEDFTSTEDITISRKLFDALIKED